MDPHDCTDTMYSSGTLSPMPRLSLTWRDWLADGKRLFVAEVMGAVMVIKQRGQRARGRRHLRDLTPHLLRDIGVTRESARRESQKSSWLD